MNQRGLLLNRLPFYLLGVLFCAAFIIYWPGLNGPLVLDSVKLYALEPLFAQYGQSAVWHTPSFNSPFGRVVPMSSIGKRAGRVYNRLMVTRADERKQRALQHTAHDAIIRLV